MLGAELLFAMELAVLYAAGSYVMGRLMRISRFGSSGSVMSRVSFCLLIFPGVVLHEGAHYLACVLTRTKVTRFAPFSPGRRSNDGRLVLGYVRHERRAFPVGALIGLAPMLVNPLGLLLVTALLTPPHISRGRQTLCRGCGRGDPREWVSIRYSTASCNLGVPVPKLRVGKRTQPRGPRESAAAASGFRRRSSRDQSLGNRL